MYPEKWMNTPRKSSIFQLKNKSLIVYLLIPLSLSALVHMWNPLGFPAFHVDEGHYMRRAMQVLEGLGPQETKETYDYGYDHPFFGQIFLATALSLLNYPNSLNPSVDLHSVEMLYLVPRLVMGILSVLDTFLVYKIAETRYNRNTALFAATLFAVMPLSRILRGILLDSIELPFILFSILFAIYYSKSTSQIKITVNGNKINKNILLVLLSGIFLGLALFTKVPVLMMIPLLVFIILKGATPSFKGRKITKNHLKILGVWFIPVILIPMLWPGYAISIGQFGDWLHGVLYQTGRQGNTNLFHSITIVTQIDPILVIFGIASIVYTAIRKDFFPLVWFLPYFVFLYLIGWVVYFHWSILLPILCIALGASVERIRKRWVAHKFIKLLPIMLISGIAIFGLVNFAQLSMSSLNTTYTNVYFFVTHEVDQNNAHADNQGDKNGTTLIGSHRIRALIWIPKYVFNDKVTFRDTDLPNDNFTRPILATKILVVADANLLTKFNQKDPQIKYSRIDSLYYNTSHTIATFIDEQEFQNNLLNLRENNGLGPFVEVRSNY